MRVLIATMSATMPTNGSMFRGNLLCQELLEKGHDVAFCAVDNINYKAINGVKNYFAPAPTLLGMPAGITEIIMNIAKVFKLPEKVKINSFEEVLKFVGATNLKYFKEDIDYLRKAIREFKPDIVYSEFRLSAIIAAKLENKIAAASISYPTQKSYASDPNVSKKVRGFINQMGFEPIGSMLDIFTLADVKFVPSSFALEPIRGEKVFFVGSFFKKKISRATNKLDTILVYMGTGSVSDKVVVREITKAFIGSKYKVYISTNALPAKVNKNVIIDKYFDFDKLLPNAISYINHGGQNSIMKGLIYGVPQIICAKGNFERKYNANSIMNLDAGFSIDKKDFKSLNLNELVLKIEHNNCYRENASKYGKSMLELGGAKKVVEILDSIVNRKLN